MSKSNNEITKTWEKIQYYKHARRFASDKQVYNHILDHAIDYFNLYIDLHAKLDSKKSKSFLVIINRAFAALDTMITVKY